MNPGPSPARNSGPASTRRDIGGFNDQWLQLLSWNLQWVDGEVARYRVRSPLAVRTWLIARPAAQPSDGVFRRLQHEYAFRQFLDPAWAIVPVALISTLDGPFVVLDENAGSALHEVMGEGLSISHFLRLAMGAAEALAQAHAVGILHGDIKPCNFIEGSDAVVRLTAFSLSQHVDSPGTGSQESISGSFAYMAPEQAGRMGYPLDQRSDLYSLGISFYEMLTGTLPFHGNDPVEWLHQHLAQQPPPLEHLRSKVPAPLRQLVLKLLAKEPAARYACALDLAHDLRQCLVQWSEFQHIRHFEPGSKGPRGLDLSVPVLVARDAELAVLHACVARCAKQGAGEVILLSGQPGTGKSALVRQLHQDLISGPIVFAAGKFDQSSKTTPYASLSLALRSLVRRILGERPQALEHWGQHLRDVLGADGALVLPLIPDLELVTGPLPLLEERAAHGVRQRFDEALRRFIGAFARAQIPLVLFFDDVQWLDLDTLSFMRSLVQAPLAHVVFIGAYREAPGEPAEAFLSFVAAARSGNPWFTEIRLVPLSPAALHEMVAALLGWDEPELRPLSAIIFDKSAGNPFFVHQLLRTLLEEKLLTQPGEGSAWQWHRESLDAFPVADNVVELMVGRIGRFPKRTQYLLGVLGMLGNRADNSDIARVSELPPSRIQRLLGPAVEAGLLVEDRQGLSFSHDRVREAAYQLIPAARRGAEHTRLARLLIKALPGQRSQGELFRIALHIQQSALDALMDHDKPQFIEALLSAAERARETAALPFALQYLRLARELGGEQRWQANYEQSYAVDFLQAQCLAHTCDYPRAHACIDQLLERVSSLTEVSALYVLKVEALSLAGDYHGAVQTGLAGLAMFGIEFPASSAQVDLYGVYRQVQQALGGRSVVSFLDHRALDNSFIKAALELLAGMIVPVLFSDRNMMFLVLCRMAEMTLRHGVSVAGVRGLAWFGVVLADRLELHEDGLRYADLASRLATGGYADAEASTLLALGRVSVWVRSLAFSLESTEGAQRCARSVGRPGLGCYASHHIVATLLVMGAPLERVSAQIEAGLALAGMLDFRDSQLLLTLQKDYVNSLCSGVPVPVPTGAAPHFQALELQVQHTSMMPARFWFWLLKGIRAYQEHRHYEAKGCLISAQALSWCVPAQVELVDLALYTALNHAALWSPGEDGLPILQAIAPHLARLQRWADLNPQSFLDRLLMVEAQVAWVKGDGLQAVGMLESAIGQAAAVGFIHMQALAHELAADLNHRLGLHTAARSHHFNAREGYQRWGALHQVKRLEAGHLYLQNKTADSRSTVDLVRGQQYLDLISVTKASQALSREIVLERLIETLVANTLVHAGARRGLLMLVRGGEPVIVATGHTASHGVKVTLGSSPVTSRLLPLSILYTVMRTGQTIALARGEHDEEFASDDYFTLGTGGSVLCLPLLKQGEVIGILYLDNSLAAGIFTHDRVTMIEVLAAQAAISLETSRLYGELQEENTRRRETEASLQMARAELAQVSHSTVLGELAASIAHEINQPLVSIVANASASVRWLQREVPDVQEALEGLRDITNDGKRAADIIHALQALAKQKDSNRSQVSIDEVIRHVLRLTAVEIAQKKVRVQTHLQVCTRRVYADCVQLQQVVYNLIVNACDAMAGVGEQQRLLTITTSEPCPEQLVVTIEDTGTGISTEHAGKIFNAFFTTKPTGMGMGLAICRSIMNAQGGTLHTLSGREQQTLFVFTLPCR